MWGVKADCLEEKHNTNLVVMTVKRLMISQKLHQTQQNTNPLVIAVGDHFVFDCFCFVHKFFVLLDTWRGNLKADHWRKREDTNN